MKKFVFVVLCLSVSLSLSAQDIIHKSDGTQIQAEVLSLDDNGVSYRDFGVAYGSIHYLDHSQFVSVDFSPVKEMPMPGMKYRYLKQHYKVKDYFKYPSWGESIFAVGITSFVLPGLGDCMVDEDLRGFVKFGTACVLVGADLIFNANNYEWTPVFEIGMIGYWIWNVVDSVKVAMIKNMYFCDLYNAYGMKLNVSPSFSPVVGPDGIKPTAGVAISLVF